MQERNRFYTSTEMKSDERLEALKELYPEIFKDGKLDFKALKGVTDLANLEVTEEDKSSYGLTWPGKLEAQRMALKKPEGTLVPAEGGKDEDTTKNIYIEGDNLEVLRILRESYKNRIKMIYIDPPYNTGNDFIYPDNFAMPVDEYMKMTGQIDEEGKKLTTNTTTGGSFHTNWLNMMYPRLKLARELLTDDGVIFISIDDNEQANLKMICDEIFGEENFIAEITREAIKGGSQSKFIRITHDYVLIYAKSVENVIFGGAEVEGITLNLKDEKGPYAKGRELNKWGAGSRREDSPSMFFPIKGPNNEDVYPIRNDGSEGRWRLGKQKMLQKVNDGDVIFEKRQDGTYIVYEKIRNNEKKIKQYTSIFKDEYINARGTEELKSLFKVERAYFDYAKPSNLVKDFCIASNTNTNDIVLDFFSGSATTAHAVMQLNADEPDIGKRKFIMVQLPEACDEKSEARKAGYNNICEIGKERIRLAGEKIKEKDPLRTQNLDVGFKVYKLQKSNFTTYEPVVGQDDKAITNLFERLENQINPLVEGYKDGDVLSEIVLRQGFALDCKIEILEEFTKNKVMRIEDAEDATRKDVVLYVCLDYKIEQETIQNLKLDDGSKFICLNEAIDDTSYARLSDKGKIETL